MSDIDHIPNDWQKLPLKRVADVTNSGCYGADDESDERSEPLRAITTAHIDPLSGFKTDNASVRYFSRSEKSKYVGHPGDIFVVKSSGSNENVITGKRAQVRYEDDLVFTNFLLRVRANERSIPRFLYHLLGSSLVHSRIKREVATTTYPNLNLRQYLGEPLPIPDLETQKAIADFLDRETARIDHLIEKKQRLVGLAHEAQRAHIQDKFAKLDARKWRVRHLGKMKNGAGFPVDLQGDASQEIAFFKVKHLKTYGLDASITETEDTVSPDIARALRATIFPAGTIVFAKIGAALLMGRFSMIGRMACIDNNMSAFIPNERLIDPNYSLLGLSQADMTTMVQPGAVPSLSTEAFNSFEMPLPAKVAQLRFVDEFRSWRSRVVKLIGATEASISKLQEFRSALITTAVTGQIDVTTWGRKGATDARLDAIEAEMEQSAAKMKEARA